MSPFGQKLRAWRKQRGLSQLALAALADTTPRHVSFIETGRSRPGRNLVLRLAECMDLPVRERNDLLVSAGLSPAFAELDLTEEPMRPFRMAVEAMLEHHEPFPACAVDRVGTVLRANRAFRLLWPGSGDRTPEESVDAFFGAGPMRDAVENFAEVAWAYVDGQLSYAARTNDPRIASLAQRALAHLDDVERPPPTDAVVVCPRFRMGDEVVRTFSTTVRFEHAREVTISELRVELIFPMDEPSAAFFERMSAAADPR